MKKLKEIINLHHLMLERVAFVSIKLVFFSCHHFVSFICEDGVIGEKYFCKFDSFGNLVFFLYRPFFLLKKVDVHTKLK